MALRPAPIVRSAAQPIDTAKDLAAAVAVGSGLPANVGGEGAAPAIKAPAPAAAEPKPAGVVSSAPATPAAPEARPIARPTSRPEARSVPEKVSLQRMDPGPDHMPFDKYTLVFSRTLSNALRNAAREERKSIKELVVAALVGAGYPAEPEDEVDRRKMGR